jgi:hypothetical protein
MPVAFIVDGICEKRIVQRLCSGTQVRTTELNGKNVSLQAIADKVETFLRLFKDRFFPIFVVVDREDRSASSLEIEDELTKLVAAKGIDINNIVIVCADRMIENWIIAGCRRYHNEEELIGLPTAKVDGSKGKSIVKQHLQRQKVAYSETTDGVDMFCQMDFELASRRSDSCCRFLQSIKGYCPKFATLNFG